MTSSTDWRDERIETLRGLIHAALPDATEERKWRKPSNPDGVPTFSQDGLICTLETYRDKVKLTFAQGASLDDPKGLFNASLDGGTRRAIDLVEDDRLDSAAFQTLVRDAARLNSAKASK